MLTTTGRERQRTRGVLREVARSTFQEEVARDAAIPECQAQPWWIPSQLNFAANFVADEPPRPVAARPASKLVGLDGEPLRAETMGSLVGPDGRRLRGDSQDVDDEDADVLELLREEFLDGDGHEEDRHGEEGHREEGNQEGGQEGGNQYVPPPRPALELADIFRRFAQEYRRQFGRTLTVQQDRALRELMVCRTAVMGWHRWRCDTCGVEAELFNSCKNRHCPKCQTQNRKDWAAKLQADLLPIEYYHVIFTVPRPVTLFAMVNPRVLYPLILRAGAEAILTLGRTWEGLRAVMALLALLHTWGQLMNPHLHSHTMVPAGGLSLDGNRWVSLPEGAFLPLDQLRRLYRELFLKGLAKAYGRGALVFPGEWQAIESATDFQQWLASLKEIDWVVRLRSVWDRRGSEDHEGAAKTVDYLARYANRVAISNSRLMAIEGDEVLFRYKDYKDGDQWKTKRMPGVEFIGRFLQHVLPKGLRHIRRFGFMGPRVHSERLNQIRELLGVPTRKELQPPLPGMDDSRRDADVEEESQDKAQEADQPSPRRCRQCGGQFVLVAQTPRPTVAQLMQMPPTMERTAHDDSVQLHLPLSAYL